MKKDLPLRPLSNTGFNWTPIGLGTWNMEKNPGPSIKAIQAGIDAGANHIDTAEMYGEGEVEKITGKALKGRRDKICLVSKVLPQNAGYDSTLRACERSLKRLQTDRLDIYLLHWREDDTPLEETFKAFEKLKEEGKIKHWGVSNFNVEDMEEAVKIAGEGKIACNQVLYYLKQRAIEEKLIPWSKEKNIPIVAYSPLGQGRMPKNDALKKIADKHNATPAQISLAFLTRFPHVFAIPKTSHAERAVENVEAGNIQLSAEDIQEIDKAFPARFRRDLPMI